MKITEEDVSNWLQVFGVLFLILVLIKFFDFLTFTEENNLTFIESIKVLFNFIFSFLNLGASSFLD